jgi:hypothetical protein
MGDRAASAGLQLHACAGDEPTAWWPAGTLYSLPDGRRAQQVGLSRIHRPIIGHDRSSAGLASRIILLAPAAMPRARQWAAISCCPCATTGTVQVVLS